MSELFKKQLESSIPVTEETLRKLSRKTYTSGKEIKVGDIILFAYRLSDPYITEGQTNINLEMITISPDEIDNYQYKQETINEIIPTIKK